MRVGQKLNCRNSSMLLYRSPDLFSVLHTPLVFCPVSVTFLLCFHSSPVFSALHLFSLFSIALSTVLSTISAQGNITVSSTVTRQFFCKTNLQQQGLCFLLRLLCGNISHIFITKEEKILPWCVKKIIQI